MMIILFGASGRLGTAIERLLPHHTYLTPDRSEVDITDRPSVDAFFDANPADIAINLAAFNNVDGAESDPDFADQINGHGAGHIAQAAARHTIPIIQFSSDYVFDGENQDGYHEHHDPRPISKYGASKLLGEQLVQEHHPTPYVLRTSRLYGHPARDPNAKRSFVEIVEMLANENETFTFNGAEVSAPTFVDDIAHYLEEHFLSKTMPVPGIYHVTNQGGCTWFEAAKEIVDILELDSVVTPRDPSENPRPASPPDFSTLVSTKLPPMRPWREALADFLSQR